jgi:ribose transport system substrate-binding protein
MSRYEPSVASRAARIRTWTVLGLLALALAAAGCGASSSETSSSSTAGSSDSGGLTAAKTAAATGAKPNVGFTEPGPAFDASKVRGKKIWIITFLSVPFAQQNVQGFKEAATAVGASVTAFDGTAGVDAYQRGIKEAVARNADAIVVGTLDPALFRTALNAAKAKGIKVVAVSSHAPGQLPSAGDPVFGYVDPCYACAGQLMADSVISDSGGKAHAVAIWSSDVRIPGQNEVGAIKSEFKEKCPGCSLDVVDVPAAQWATRLQPVTQATLASKPDVKYLLPLYDGMVSFMVPAIRAAAANRGVKIASFNATPAVMQQIGDGKAVLADVGIGSVRYGWGWADQTFRALAGAKPVADEKLPVRLFDPTNIGSVDLKASTDTWYGDVDYRSAYKKLWGVTP